MINFIHQSVVDNTR